MEVAESLEERAARAGMKVAVAGDDDAELPLRPRMIRVVAYNLASNAIRYAGPGAQLTLSVLQEGEQIVLSAADTGVGVEATHLPGSSSAFTGPTARARRAGPGSGLRS